MHIKGVAHVNDYHHVAALPAERLLRYGVGGAGGSDEEDEGEGEGEGSKVTTVELEFDIKKYIER